jgi:hypothetical protein
MPFLRHFKNGNWTLARSQCIIIINPFIAENSTKNSSIKITLKKLIKFKSQIHKFLTISQRENPHKLIEIPFRKKNSLENSQKIN